MAMGLGDASKHGCRVAVPRASRSSSLQHSNSLPPFSSRFSVPAVFFFRFSLFFREYLLSDLPLVSTKCCQLQLMPCHTCTLCHQPAHHWALANLERLGKLGLESWPVGFSCALLTTCITSIGNHLIHPETRLDLKKNMKTTLPIPGMYDSNQINMNQIHTAPNLKNVQHSAGGSCSLGNTKSPYLVRQGGVNQDRPTKGRLSMHISLVALEGLLRARLREPRHTDTSHTHTH